MQFYADLHLHSKYSRATSRNLDLENMAFWAQKKGVTVLVTGDFTHPVWMSEIREKLVADGSGLFRLKPDLEREIEAQLPSICRSPVRFMLGVEISTIYKKGDKVRKVHHLLFAPNLEAAEKIRMRLGRIGNIKSDGRPILGLDSRNLLEITLESHPDSFLIPAHIWTPWFSALGSKSGFDSIDECYGDLAHHIFAVETGLSSDPEMNWRVSSLDRFRLVSNSDAHSPQKIGREACMFSTGLDYGSIKRALETGEGYGGTVEFFPEEGKYHADGHRSCGVRLTPEESLKHEGRCPHCQGALTLGVLHRVQKLADRAMGEKPIRTDPFKSLIPLTEVLGELCDVGPSSKTVAKHYENVTSLYGPELKILSDISVDDLERSTVPFLGEALHRMRQGNVIRHAGYDGEFGEIRLFEKGELK
ncbi:MAG: hypothetical protein HY540_02530 [Deltaproteobacteria bacterium]|nr:hypothetical protein [Deltaproteobacteria bacterium]